MNSSSYMYTTDTCIHWPLEGGSIRTSKYKRPSPIRSYLRSSVALMYVVHTARMADLVESDSPEIPRCLHVLRYRPRLFSELAERFRRGKVFPLSNNARLSISTTFAKTQWLTYMMCRFGSAWHWRMGVKVDHSDPYRIWASRSDASSLVPCEALPLY